MKNKLRIITERDENLIEIFKVEDANTLYVVTRTRAVAEKAYKELKLEYKKEQENASKI